MGKKKGFKIKIDKEELAKNPKVRFPIKPTKVIKDKSKYTRKEKHKKDYKKEET